jgi:hypothetical protein
MLDVHPPHEPAYTWRDFFVHLATITIGLFIALTLEGCVEWAHHRHLVREARDNLHQEIEGNRKELREAPAALPKSEQAMKDDIANLRLIRNRRPTSVHSMSYSFVGATLRRSSWDTARDTGALSYMPYQEVQGYADVYSLQSMVEQLNTRLIEAEANGIGTIMIVEDPIQLTPEQADRALAAAASVQSQLLVTADIAKQLEQKYSDLLKK